MEMQDDNKDQDSDPQIVKATPPAPPAPPAPPSRNCNKSDVTKSKRGPKPKSAISNDVTKSRKVLNCKDLFVKMKERQALIERDNLVKAIINGVNKNIVLPDEIRVIYCQQKTQIKCKSTKCFPKHLAHQLAQQYLRSWTKPSFYDKHSQKVAEPDLINTLIT